MSPPLFEDTSASPDVRKIHRGQQLLAIRAGVGVTPESCFFVTLQHIGGAKTVPPICWGLKVAFGNPTYCRCLNGASNMLGSQSSFWEPNIL